MTQLSRFSQFVTSHFKGQRLDSKTKKWRRDENTRRASRAYLMEFYAFFARVTLFRPVLDIVYILSFILDWNLPGYIRLVTLKSLSKFVRLKILRIWRPCLTSTGLYNLCSISLSWMWTQTLPGGKMKESVYWFTALNGGIICCCFGAFYMVDGR